MDNQSLDENDKYEKECVDPDDVNKSVYRYCKATKTGFNQIMCNRDMCEMCCNSLNMIFNTQYSKNSINKCSFGCYKKYKVNK